MEHVVSTDLNLQVVLNAAGQPGGLSLICARGADAGSFLQGQLTNDVLLMNENQARLSAWCSAKGRMLASFVVWKNAADEFYLLLSSDLLAATLKRLKMFVLRAKCELTDVTAQYCVMGLAGDAANTINLISTSADSMPANSLKPSEKTILLPSGWVADHAVARALHIAPVVEPVAAPGSAAVAVWHALELSSGIARISTAVSEAFVPQMLNYESVGGVNFKKGCYPGQEVVARSQFRGTLKRRAYLVRSAAPLHAGQEVFHSSDTEQPCGLVAQAAEDVFSLQAGAWLAVVSMQTSAASGGSLHAGSAQGSELTLQPLPYTLLDDI
ncbi:MAG: YgfZ/GcvT domain-containing protein [Brachymonas sp.]